MANYVLNKRIDILVLTFWNITSTGQKCCFKMSEVVLLVFKSILEGTKQQKCHKIPTNDTQNLKWKYVALDGRVEMTDSIEDDTSINVKIKEKGTFL